jgi:hypothetical protein
MQTRASLLIGLNLAVRREEVAPANRQTRKKTVLIRKMIVILSKPVQMTLALAALALGRVVQNREARTLEVQMIPTLAVPGLDRVVRAREAQVPVALAVPGLDLSRAVQTRVVRAKAALALEVQVPEVLDLGRAVQTRVVRAKAARVQANRVANNAILFIAA